MVKFEKNERLDVLIVWQEMSKFYFSLENDLKGGPLEDFIHYIKVA